MSGGGEVPVALLRERLAHLPVGLEGMTRVPYWMMVLPMMQLTSLILCIVSARLRVVHLVVCRARGLGRHNAGAACRRGDAGDAAKWGAGTKCMCAAKGNHNECDNPESGGGDG